VSPQALQYAPGWPTACAYRIISGVTMHLGEPIGERVGAA